MNTHLINIKYIRWDGDILAANMAFRDDAALDVDTDGSNLVLKSAEHPDQYLKVKKGLFIVAIPDPVTVGYKYYRLDKVQLNRYLDMANGGNHVVLE